MKLSKATGIFLLATLTGVRGENIRTRNASTKEHKQDRKLGNGGGGNGNGNGNGGGNGGNGWQLVDNPSGTLHLTETVIKTATKQVPNKNVPVEIYETIENDTPVVKESTSNGKKQTLIEKKLTLKRENRLKPMIADPVDKEKLNAYVDTERMYIDGFVPDFLDVNTQPKIVPVPKKFKKDNMAAESQAHPTSVIGEDNRVVYDSTAYPWSTVGKVVTDWGICTGTMVGRNIMLTAAHCVTEYDDGTIAGLTFTPAYYDGSKPFGVAEGVKVLKNNVVNPENGLTYTEVANDYAVVVLNWFIGDETGWMGVHKYRNIWDGEAKWINLGYPCDLTGSEKPVYSVANIITSTKDMGVTPENYVLVTNTDTYVGQSGGPLMGWWDSIDGSSWPLVIGDISAEWVGENYASGGPGLEELILYARNEFESESVV